MEINETPNESAVAAAYQVTSRWFASTEQLIWKRTGIFLGLQSIIAVVIYYFRMDLPKFLSIILPGIFLFYCICWHFSMSRTWTYHRFIIRMMREQERFLKLKNLGCFLRGRQIVDGGKGELVDGELTVFPVSTLIFRAKTLADATTWLFALVYFVLLILGLFNLI